MRWLALIAVLLMAGTATSGEKKSPTGPWELKELQKTPKATFGEFQEVSEGEAKVQITTVYYDGEPWMGKPTRVFGYYARPSVVSERKLPAMVLVHGGGGTAFPEWARLWAARGYAALAMDLSGSGPERKRLEDGGPDQSDEWKFKRLKDGVKNAWPYYAVAAVIRGHSLLRSRPEVDRNRVGITGISWGGYLTSIVMSLDGRLKAAVPVYGCGYLHENSAWVATLNSLPPDEKQTWIENFDPSEYLPRCKTPVLWMNGTNDFAYPLDSYRKSYRAMPGPKTLCVTVKMPHSHPAGWARQEIHLFTDAFFKKNELATGLARVSPPIVDGEKVKLLYESDTAIQHCRIHWTADLDKPWAQREWSTANGRVVGLNDAEADLPKQKPCVYFLTLEDHRGAVTSTEHVELK